MKTSLQIVSCYITLTTGIIISKCILLRLSAKINISLDVVVNKAFKGIKVKNGVSVTSYDVTQHS